MADSVSFRLADKVAIITGASSGIGASTAVLFSKLGAKLVLTGRNEENLKKTAKQCQESSTNNYQPFIVVGDLTQSEFVEDIVKQATSHYGQVDILVNNAGIIETGSIESTSPDQLQRVFDINVKAAYHLTMLAVPHLIKTKGTIVNVSSVTGLRSFPGVLAYCMSKSALDQFTCCVALELAPKGVRVNSVNAGVTYTELHKRGGMDQESYDMFVERSGKSIALGYVAKPLEISKAIAFLASEESSYMTGVLLPVDGGRHAMCPR